MKRFFPVIACVAAAVVSLPVTAQVNGVVVEGTATIDTSVPFTTTITTETARTILEFDSFNLPNSRAAVFNQPTADSAVLNRITNGSPTNIQGTVTSNGQVYFVNPAGVSFSSTAVVNVARLVAAAGNLSNDDFLAGVDNFTGNTGLAQNLSANLFATEGVVLVGKNVTNLGTITADNGAIVLVSGDDVFLQDGPDGQILIEVSGFGPSPGGSPQSVLNNQGTLDPGPEGQVFLGAGDLLGISVFNSGTIRGERVTFEFGDADVALSDDSSFFASVDPDTAITVNAGSFTFVADNAPLDRLTLNTPDPDPGIDPDDPADPADPGDPADDSDAPDGFTFVDAFARRLPIDPLAVAAANPATIDAAQAAAFERDLLIDVKDFDEQPLLDYLVAATVLNDLSPGSSLGTDPGPTGGGTRISANRLDYVSAQNALDAYSNVFYADSIVEQLVEGRDAAAGDAVGAASAGGVAATDQTQRVRSVIQAAADRYMADAETTEIDPVEFVSWLREQDAEALDALAGLNELVNEAMPELGLGASELDRFRQWTYGKIAPEGVSLRTLDEMVATAGRS